MRHLPILLLLAARALASGVFISEYVEGSSYNKALEVYNGSGAALSLADYRFGLASNGAATPTYYTFSGTLAAGEVFVVAHASANAAILAVADQLSSGFANWNGDDFVGLYQMVAGSPVLIDAVGVLGTDPGTAWAVAGVADGTLNHTLARKAAVTQGSTNWSQSAGSNATDSQWIVSPVDTFGGLGSHSMAAQLPPVVANLSHSPQTPGSGQAVTAEADVSDDGALAAVLLSYSVNGGAAQTLAMSAGAPPRWAGLIPAQADGSSVAWHVEATDDLGLVTVSAADSYSVADQPPPVPVTAPSFSEAGLALGQVSTTATGQATAHLLNTGATTVLVRHLFAAGAPFTVSPSWALLAPGQSLPVTVQLQPPHNLHYAGWLVASGDWGATALPLSADGDYPGTAWDATYNLSGEALKSQLAALVSVQDPLSYDAARQAMYGSLDNVNGWVECVYTGLQVETSGIPDPAIMNTEHTWPQSYGAEGEARSDLHHLFPADAWINSSRGNLPFGEVVVSSGGYPIGGSDRGSNAQGQTVFEPRDAHKGDCARAVMYFALRYGNRSGFLDMAAQEGVLRAWHGQDAVSNKERTRNNGIEALQHNRNPFIDQPGLLLRMASLSGSAELPVAPAALSSSPDTLALAAAGAPLTAQLWLCNTGGAALAITGLSSDEPGCVSLGAAPASLAPGAAAAVPVTISGACDGQALLSIATSAGTRQVPLTWSWSAAAPAAPVLAITQVTGGRLLSWPAVAGATSYRIESAPGLDGPWTPLATISATQYLVGGEIWPVSLFRVVALAP